MMRSQHSAPKPVSHKRRNSLAILISFAAVSLLYFNFEPTPAGGSFSETIDLDKVSQDVVVPTGYGDPDQNGGGDSDGSAAGSRGKNSLQGKTALLVNLMLLERGIRKFADVEDYTATFYKRERVEGTIGDAQVMRMKLRQKPFSVYMKWLKGDVGRELLYVDGKYDGKMLVKLGGVKGRLLPTVKLDPKGRRALSEARHPVTDLGLLNLAKLILDYRRQDMKLKSGFQCRMFDNQVFNDRRCFCFIVEYSTPDISKVYRKSIVFIDKEWSVPVCVQNFGWPAKTSTEAADLDKETIIEDYRYSSIRLNQKIADRHFDRYNKNYRLKR